MNVYPDSIPDLGIKLDTPEWFEWLDTQTQFKYCGNLTEMSVKRRPNSKWYARKKIRSTNGSKPVDLYIGSDEECTSEALKEINYQFSQDWVDFWKWYYSPDRKGDRSKGVQPSSVYTLTEATLKSGEDVARLQARITELELKLSSTEKKLERESGDAQKYYVLWRKYPDLERQFKRKEEKLRESESAIATLEQKLMLEQLNSDHYRKQVSPIKALEEKLTLEQSNSQHCRRRVNDIKTEGLRATAILRDALKLPANKGGAIKVKIKEALKLIDSIYNI